MKWPWHKQCPASTLLRERVSGIVFLREQVGESESLLKEALSSVFCCHEDEVRCYLARVSIDGKESVSLCIKSGANPDANLMEKIGATFQALFSSSERLDIVWLGRDQEAELLKVCSPFFGPNTRREGP